MQTDAALEKEEEERLESPNLGVVSSSVVTSELKDIKKKESKETNNESTTPTRPKTPLHDEKQVDEGKLNCFWIVFVLCTCVN